MIDFNPFPYSKFWSKGIVILLLAALNFQCNINQTESKEIMNIKWTLASKVPAKDGKQLGYAGPSVGVYDAYFLVIGGANFPEKAPWLGGQKVYYKDINIFKKEENGALSLFKTTALTQNIAYAATCSSSQGILMAGGENENGPSDKVFLLRWENEALLLDTLPHLPQKITNGQIAVWEDKAYFAGGEDANTVYTNFLMLDLKNPSEGWKVLAALPQATSSGVLIAQLEQDQPKIFLLGGRKKNPGRLSNFYSQLYAYDIAANTWTAKAAMPYGLAAGTGIAFGNHHILLFGGDKGVTFNKTEALINMIALEKNPQQKQAFIDEKTALQESHPGFSSAVLSYNTNTDLWEQVSNIPFPGQVTTTAVSWGDDIYIANGEIRAGVRTPDIIHGKAK